MRMASPRYTESTPICRCRVLYLGSSVPHVTKDGLQGIQEPLRELYPEQGALGARGIDSWLSVWSNGVLLENVDENHKKVTRFFPIGSLHYCAAVRYVLVPEKSHVNSSSQPRFLPLDSPFARSPNPNHPPLFACILRRTTGIKVLECHAFICKREMAANALVRCCFHAYADSSYVRHIDSGGASGQTGSLYGTLRGKTPVSSSANSIEKVEVWRGMSSPPPVTSSTLTLDSAVHIPSINNGASLVLNTENSNSNDDVSIYNGDENHKIWAGSTRDITVGDDAIYGEYGTSTMRSSKSSRPRQIINAPPPPPPPPKEEKQSKKASKEKSRRKKMTGGSREEMYPLLNGSLLRPGNTVRSQGSAMGMYNQMYANGTMVPHSPPMMPPYPQTPPMVMVPATLPHPPRFLVQGPNKGMAKQRAPILPPNFHPMTPPPPPSLFIPSGRKGFKPHPMTMEEPIYMPSNRPMSPVSSYQPCHFPHEAYLMQQYATMDPNPKRKGNRLKKPLPMSPMGPYDPEWSDPNAYHRREKEGKNGKLSSNSEHRSEEEDADNIYGTHGSLKKDKDPKGSKKSLNGIRREDDGESPYNTGIYRRKGHLNERAFSYSIRQEHRSRSYGSLANLKFTPLPVVPNGGGPPVEAQYLGETISREELKKEREIMQMMQDLELSGGELERSEVPPAVYQQARQRNATKVRR